MTRIERLTRKKEALAEMLRNESVKNLLTASKKNEDAFTVKIEVEGFKTEIHPDLHGELIKIIEHNANLLSKSFENEDYLYGRR
jgi:hypothetical protein